jgi:hypothetical protein
MAATLIPGNVQDYSKETVKTAPWVPGNPWPIPGPAQNHEILELAA